MNRNPAKTDPAELLLARAFASQVRRWLDADPAPDIEAADRARIVAAAEALALATSAGHVCLDLAELDASDPAGLRRALTVSGIVAGVTGSSMAGDSDAMRADSRPLVLDANGRLYLHRYFDLEQRLARRLIAALAAPPRTPTSAARALLATLFDANAAQLGGRVDWQRLAAAQALRSRLAIISGGPGTGKTTTVVNLLACLVEQDAALRIALAAPTGKAAARLIEAISTRAAALPEAIRERMPRTARTVHRLLGASPRAGQGGLRFRHDADRPLPLDLLVVDEASMLDLAMATRLLEAVPAEATIVLLGDKDQLSAVEAGAVFAEIGAASALTAATRTALSELAEVDATLLASAPAAAPAPTASPARTALQDQVTWLVESWRFGIDSPIGRLAGEINRGQRGAALERLRAAAGGTAGGTAGSTAGSTADSPLRWLDDGDDDATPGLTLERTAIDGYRALFKVIVREADAAQPDRLAVLAAFDRFRVLCAVHGGPRGVETLNLRLTEAARAAIDPYALIDEGRWFEGRPVVMQANDYAVGLFNGDVGVTLRDEAGRLRVWFADAALGVRAVDPVRLPRHRTAYAMTVHQAQGSEFDEVLVVLPLLSSRVLTREWLYTAVTRARHRVTLAGPAARIGAAIDTPTRRHSGLLNRLDEQWPEAGSSG